MIPLKGQGMRRRDFVTIFGRVGSLVASGSRAALRKGVADRVLRIWSCVQLDERGRGLCGAACAISVISRVRISSIEFRWAERADQTFDLATELVRMNVDVIFAPASTQVEPARRATNTVPIVFAQHADPVGLGRCGEPFAPRREYYRLSMLLTELSVKELEILRETLPDAARFGVL